MKRMSLLSPLLLLFLLVGVILPAGPTPAPIAEATTHHAITIDGDLSDWEADEFMELDLGGNYGLYLTWDAANVYLGLTGATLGDTVGQDKSFFVCFDTDLVPLSGAPVDGYGRVLFNISVLAPEFCYYFAGGAGWYEWTSWNGAGWDWMGWRDDGTYYNYPGNPAPLPGSEFTILLSDLGNPSTLGVVAWLTPEAGTILDAAWPTPNPPGSSPVFNHFYHVPMLEDGLSPNRAVLADHVIINELDNYTEWVELYNPTAGPVDIGDWLLTSQVDGLTYTIPAGTFIEAGGYYSHTSSGDLDNGGEVVSLTNAVGTLIDQVGYGNWGGAPVPSTVWRTVARVPNGSDSDDHARDWNLTTTPTRGSANLVPPVLLGSSLLFNEFDNYPPSGGDQFELYNPTTATITITNWYVSDGDAVDQITGAFSVPAGGWLVLTEDDPGSFQTDFSSYDVGYLFLPNGIRVEQIGWAGEYEDETFQRICDGDGPNDGYDWTSSGGGVTWFDLPDTFSATNTPGPVDMAVYKTGPITVAPGTLITYVVTYQALSPMPTTAFVLTDTLPTEVAYQSYSADPALVLLGTDPLEWDAGAYCGLPSGVITITGYVTDTAANGTILTNEVEIDAAGDISPTNDVATWDTTVEAGCLPPTVAFDSDSPVMLGDPMHFTATVGGSAPFTYTWDFGGPGSGTGLDTATPVYTYSITGTFSVQLTVSNACGVDSIAHDVTVSDMPLVVINEVMYNPPPWQGIDDDYEWAELYNLGSAPVDMSGWTFGNLDQVTIPSGTVLLGDDYLIIARNALSFTNWYGPVCQVVDAGGAYFGLSNTAGDLYLKDNSGITIDRLVYIDDWDGYGADGTGSSLEKIQPDVANVGDSSLGGPDDANWDPSTCSLGSPCDINCVYPNAAMAKDAPAHAAPGDTIFYTLYATNTGGLTLTNVLITDWLPVADVTYVSDTSGLPLVGTDPWVWDAGELSPYQPLSFTIEVIVSATLSHGYVIVNSVLISTDTPERTTADNLAIVSTTVVMAEVGVDKVGPIYVLPGGTISYTLSYEIIGDPAQSVVLTDVLPADVTYLYDTAPVVPTEPVAGTFVWDMGTVTDTASFGVYVLVSATPTTTTLHNQVWISALTDTDPLNNYAYWDSMAYPLVPIYDIQYVPDPINDDASPYEGQVVWTEGVVVAGTGEIGSSGNNFVIEDPAGGPWSGLMVYAGGVFSDVVEGDYVRLLGLVDEYYGMTELDISSAPNALQVLSTSHPLPAPEIIATGVYTTASPDTAEPYESVLIEFQAATVTDEDLGNDEWAFDDGSGATRADDYGEVDGNLTYVPQLGHYYTFIRGIAWYSWDNYKLMPRYDPDIELAYPITLIYHDLEDAVLPGEALYAAGDFNGWVPTTTLLLPNVDHSVFSVTLTVDVTGTYAYKYVVYTDTVPSGPANWNWLQTNNRQLPVTQSVTTDDYRFVEPGYVVLQYPAATTTTAGLATENIYGQIWADDLTSRPGAPRALLAEVGYGTDVDPANWTDWFDMAWGSQQGNNDEFYGVMTPTAAGVYSYVVSFNANWGIGNPHDMWHYGDTDGVSPGDPFEIENAGVLTVLELIAPDLSTSEKVSDRPVLQPGELFSYTMYLSNTGNVDALVVITDVLPIEIAVVTDTLPAGLTYDDLLHQLYWSGDILQGEQVELVFQAIADAALLDGDVFTNVVWIDDGFHVPFDRDEAVQVVVPCVGVSDADFDWTPPLPVMGEVVTFTAWASGTAPIGFDWDFGDGNLGAGDTATHVYTAAGSYVVYMLASNACGWDAISRTVNVVAEACEAVAIVTFTYDAVGCVVTFDPEVTGDAPFTYTWTFGDGDTSAEEMPTHTYLSGTYTVMLEVWNCAGNAYNTLSLPLTVACAPEYKVYLPLVFKLYDF